MPQATVDSRADIEKAETEYFLPSLTTKKRIKKRRYPTKTQNMIVKPFFSELENANFNNQKVVIDETSSELKTRPIGNLVFDTIRTTGHFISSFSQQNRIEIWWLLEIPSYLG